MLIADKQAGEPQVPRGAELKDGVDTGATESGKRPRKITVSWTRKNSSPSEWMICGQ